MYKKTIKDKQQQTSKHCVTIDYDFLWIHSQKKEFISKNMEIYGSTKLLLNIKVDIL